MAEHRGEANQDSAQADSRLSRAADRLKRLLGLSENLAADAGEHYQPASEQDQATGGRSTHAEDAGATALGSIAVGNGSAGQRDGLPSINLSTEGLADLAAAAPAAARSPESGFNGVTTADAMPNGGGEAAGAAAGPRAGAGGAPAVGNDGTKAPPLHSAGTTDGVVIEDTRLEASGQVTVQGGFRAHAVAETLTGRYGDLTIDSNGHWHYQLRPGAGNDPSGVQGLNNGESYRETFLTQVTDGTGQRLQVPVVINVQGTDDAAVIQGVRTGAITEDLGPQTTGGQLNATDIDHGDLPWFRPETLQGHYGSFRLDANGTWNYTADPSRIQGLKAGEQVIETFPVATTNAQGESVAARVSIAIVGTDDKAVFPPLSLTATEDGGMVTGHLAATDADAQKLTYGLAPGALLPAGISVDPDGTVHVDPSRPEFQSLASGEHRDLQVPVQVTDERGVSVPSLLNVRIDGTNDVPAVTVHPPVPVDEGSGTHNTQVLAVDVDSSDKLSYGLPAGLSLPPGVSLDPGSGQLTIDTNHAAYNHLAAGEVQNVVVPVVVSDGHGGVTNTQVVFEVHGTNDAPVLAAIAQRTASEGSAPINGQLTATDPDSNDQLTFGLAPGIQPPAGFSLSPDGHWSFDPRDPAYDNLRNGDHQQLMVPVQVSDGHGGVSQQSIAITVIGTNDGAQISGSSSGSVTEDVSLQARGLLNIADPDGGQAHFQAGDLNGSYGVLHLDADGHWLYQLDNAKAQGLNNGDLVREQFNVLSADGTSHPITITVNGSNDAAVITGARSGALTEDQGPQSASGTLIASDIDRGDQPSFIAQTVQGTYGSFNLQADGHWSYQLDNARIQHLAEGQQVSETFPIQTTNAQGESVAAAVSIRITGSDDRSIFPAVSLSAKEDGGLVVGHLVATDADARSLHYETVPGSIPIPGVSVERDGTVHIDPSQPEFQSLAAGEHRDLQLPVQVVDERGTAVPSLLHVRIDGTNDAPSVTVQPPLSVDEGSGVRSIQVLAHDLDTSDTLRFDLPAGQSLPPGVSLDTATGLLTIDSNHPAYNHLSAGDTQTLVIPVVVSDGHGGSSNTAVSLELHGTNDQPALAAINQRTVQEGDAPLSSQLTATDPDSNDQLSYGLAPGIQPPAGFSLSPDGHWSFDPRDPAYDNLRNGDHQQLMVPVQVSDGHGGVSQQSIAITVIGTNDGAQISGSSSGALKEDTTLQASGKLDVSDVDQGEAHFQAGDLTGSYGTLHLQADGHWTYDLNNNDPRVQALAAGQQVSETLTVQSADGSQHQITVTVSGTNDATLISGVQTGSITEDVGPQQASGVLSASDIDAGQTPSFVPQSIKGTYGSLDLQADGHWQYTADPQKIQGLKEGQQVVDSFPVATTNASGESATATISVGIVGTNDKPVFPPLSLTAKEDGPNVIGRFAASDPDFTQLKFALVPGTQLPAGVKLVDAGILVHPGDPAFQSLAAGEHRDLQIPVQVTDDRGATVVSLVTIRIEGTNDAPQVTVHPPVPVTEDSGVHNTQVLARDVDASDTLSYGLAPGVALPAGVTLDPATGQVAIDANNPAYNHLGVGQVQNVVVPIVVSDGHGGSTATQVTFELHGSNDAPVLAAIGQRTATEGDAPITGQLSASDPDNGDQLSYGLATGTRAPAGFTLQADGHWGFDPKDPAYDHLRAGEQQQVVVALQVSDGHGGMSQQNLTITVTGTNDGAVIAGTSTGSVTEDGQQVARGQLSVADLDLGEALFKAGDFPASYGVLHVMANGSWSFTLDNNDPDVQGLPQGQSILIRTSVESVDGTRHEITITIHGTDDKAVISGTSSGVVKEDVTHMASGQLQVSDVDQGENPAFHAETLQGVYGQLVIDASGHWTYQLDNAAAQVLQEGTQARETFTVLASDANGHQVQQTVLVDVQGTADAAVISGTATGNASEDQVLQASGKLTVIDPDRNEAHFNSGDQTGTYGTLHMGADGTWSYQLNNASPLVQQLTGRDQVSDRFTVTSADGTTHQITIQVAGRNDVAQISGTTSGQVTEDGLQTAKGQLSVSDVDRGEATFAAGDQVGTYGTLHMGADGAWTYTLNNADPKVQGLAAGTTVSDTFTVRSADGTTQQLSVRVSGSNDAAVISGTDTGHVSEDGTTSTRGQLQVQDVDQGEAGINPSDVGDKVGQYGTLHVDADGSWTYQLNNSARNVQDLQAGDVVQDSFTVRSIDGTSHVLHLSVTGASDAPVLSAGQQLIGAKEDTSFTLTQDQILKALQASDPDGDHLHIASLSYAGSDATLTDNGNGTWTLVPHANWSGDVQLRVGVSDGHDTTTGTLTVPVAAVADQVRLTVAPSLSSTFEDPTLGNQGYHFTDPTQWGWHTDNASGLVEQGKGETYGDPNHANTGLIELEGQSGEKDNLFRVLDTQPGAMYHFSLDVSGRHGTTDLRDAGVEILWEGKVIDTIYPDVDKFGFVRHNYDLTATTSNPRIEFRALTHNGSGPIVDNPNFQFRGFRGTEDSPLPIKLTLESPDKDGSETLSAAIKGLPAGFVLTDGTSGHRLTSTGETQIINMPGWDPQHLQVIPPANFNGQVNAVVIATATEGSNHDQSSTEIQVPLVFDAVNDLPTVQITQGSALSEGATGSSTAQLSGRDVDGDVTQIDTAWLSAHGWSSSDGGVTYTKAGTYGTATLTVASGSMSYLLNNTPGGATDHLAAGQNVRDTFDVQISDGHVSSTGTANPGTVIGTAIFNVTGTNDAPTVTAGSATPLAEGSTGSASSILTIQDPDSTDQSPTVDTTWLTSHGWTTTDHGATYSHSGTYGTAVLSVATNTVSYHLDNTAGGATDQLAAGQSVHDAFAIQVVDSHGATAMANPSFQVDGSNDGPVVTAGSATPASLEAATEDTVKVYTEADLLHLVGASDPDSHDTLHIKEIHVDPAVGSFQKASGSTNWEFHPAKDFAGNHQAVQITVTDGKSDTVAHGQLDVGSVTDKATASIGISTSQQVMTFGEKANHNNESHVYADVNTGGALHAVTFELTSVGDPNHPGDRSATAGPVILNYGTSSNNNIVSFWRPANLSIAINGHDYATDSNLAAGVTGGIDMTAGGTHRITATWDSATGTLRVYDNGILHNEFTGVSTGQAIPDGGTLTLGQKMNTQSSHSGWYQNEQFSGSIFSASVANKALSATEINTPLANHLDSSHGLILDIRMQNGVVANTVSGHGGAFTANQMGHEEVHVDASSALPPPGAKLNLQVSAAAQDADDKLAALELRGLPPGSVLADGHHTHTISDAQERINITDWQLGGLTVQLPGGSNANFAVQVLATTRGPDGTLAVAESHSSVIFDAAAAQPTVPDATPASLPAGSGAATRAMAIDPMAPELHALFDDLRATGLDLTVLQRSSHSETDAATGIHRITTEVSTDHGHLSQTIEVHADGHREVSTDTSQLDSLSQEHLSQLGSSPSSSSEVGDAAPGSQPTASPLVFERVVEPPDHPSEPPNSAADLLAAVHAIANGDLDPTGGSDNGNGHPAAGSLDPQLPVPDASDIPVSGAGADDDPSNSSGAADGSDDSGLTTAQEPPQPLDLHDHALYNS